MYTVKLIPVPTGVDYFTWELPTGSVVEAAEYDKLLVSESSADTDDVYEFFIVAAGQEMTDLFAGFKYVGALAGCYFMTRKYIFCKVL